MYNLDITKTGLDFGVLDLNFKVTAVETLNIWWGPSVSSENIVLVSSGFYEVLNCGVVYVSLSFKRNSTGRVKHPCVLY